jgi:hypothetical protein
MRAFHEWEAGELQDAINAYESTRLLSTTATSTSSVLIGTGDKTFAVASSLGFVAGQSVNVVSTANPANSMSGFVKSYSSTTLIVTVLSITGSGTLASWAIALGLSGGGATLGTNTFTGVQNYAQGSDIASATTINLTTATGNVINITGTTATSAVTLGVGMTRLVRAVAAWPLTYNATTNNITGGVSTTLAAGDMVFYQNLSGVIYGLIIKQSGRAVVEIPSPLIRQAILSMPLDANGLANGGGSTGSTTVTASGTWIVTTANGFDSNGPVNRVGTIVNPSFTGLNGASITYYLFLTVASNGTCTPSISGATPVYQFGGTPSVTNGLYTFNTQEMKMYVGNGSTASQTNTVFIGEATTSAGSVVTSITWYQPMGRYWSGYNATLFPAGGTYSRNHNIGWGDGTLLKTTELIRCLTAEGGYALGDVLINPMGNIGTYAIAPSITSSRNTTTVRRPSTNGYLVSNKSTGVGATLTAANWEFGILVERVDI